jgi:hypothetical protein
MLAAAAVGGSIVYYSNFEGIDGSTAFTDLSPAANTCVANGNVQYDAAQYKFGGSSAYFDGSGDYIAVGGAGDTDFAFGSGAFTIEFWVRYASAATEHGMVSLRHSTAGDILTVGRLSGNLYFRWRGADNSLFDITYPWVPTVGVWYHICCERDATGKSRLYINGTMVNSLPQVLVAGRSVMAADGTLRIGSWGDAFFLHGHMDEVRITKGAAQYGSDAGFTVATTSFSSALWYASLAYTAPDLTPPAALIDFRNNRYALPTIGAEMVTNGTFDTDVSGWTNASGNGSVTWNAGRLSFTYASDALRARAQTTITTVVGKFYQLTFQNAGTNNVDLNIGTTSGAFDVLNAGAQTPATRTYYFTAASTTTYISFWPTLNSQIGTVRLIDNVSVKEVQLDVLSSATFAECFTFTATSAGTARTYIDANGVIQTDTAVDAPRFDYTFGARQLLTEDAKTNAWLWSEDFTNAIWTKSNCTVSAPASGWTQMRETVTNSFHRIAQPVTVAGGVVQSASAMIRKAGRRYVLFRVDWTGATAGGTFRNITYDLDTVTVAYASTGLTGSIIAVPGGSFLISVWATAGASGSGYTCGIVTAATLVTSDGIPQFAGDTAQGVDIRYMQTVQGANSPGCSYIPTTTASVTRAVESCRFSPLLEAVFARAATSGVTKARMIYPSVSGGAAFRVMAFNASQSMASGYGNTTSRNSNGTVVLDATAGSGGWTTGTGVAFGIDGTGRSISMNGGTIATDTNVVPARTTAWLGRDSTPTAGTSPTAWHDFVSIYPARLTNASLVALATPA